MAADVSTGFAAVTGVGVAVGDGVGVGVGVGAGLVPSRPLHAVTRTRTARVRDTHRSYHALDSWASITGALRVRVRKNERRRTASITTVSTSS